MSTDLDAFPGSSPRPGTSPVYDALATLESSGAVYALLRGGPTSGRHGGDVDILVCRADMPQAIRSLQAAGWLAAPAAGHGSHRFLVRYDRPTGTWQHLDLVTRLEFGPTQAYRTPPSFAESCLARRTRVNGIPTLHPDDAFWSLFVHLAWKDATSTRRSELEDRARDASSTGPVADLVARLLSEGTAAPERALSAARAGEWDVVRCAQRRLRARWRRSARMGVTWNHATSSVLRRGAISKDVGLSVALLGLDGAGKTTVASKLQADIPWPTVSLYMGVWRESALDHLVRHITGARLALRLGRLTRTGLVTRYHRRLGRVVLLDRYVVDANLPSPDLDWKGRISAVLVLRTASPPDRLVFLDAPPEVVFARKGELTISELERRRECYHALKHRFPQLVTINADQPLDQVLREMSELLWDDLVRSRSAPVARG